MAIKISDAVLRVDEDTRQWMGLVLEFLAAKPEYAFHREELMPNWPELGADSAQRDRFLEALLALTAVGAVESKEIEGRMFYIFSRKADPAAWKLLEESAA